MKSGHIDVECRVDPEELVEVLHNGARVRYKVIEEENFDLIPRESLEVAGKVRVVTTRFEDIAPRLHRFLDAAPFLPVA
jgi:hypothetical protein